ncbi:MAG: glycosyl hydrolase family 18 protein [Kofleriaceae bacterium]
MTKLAAIMIVCAACSGASTSGGSDAGANEDGAVDGAVNPSGRWVLGYYVGYDIDSYPIADIDWTTLTHVAFAPLLVKADRTIDLSFYDQHGLGEQHAREISAAARAANVKALLMLGGAGAGANIAAAATDEHRAELVTALLATLDDLGYDGLDLDWEDDVNLDDLVSLAQDLRAARPSIILTYPGGPINPNFQTVDPRMVDLAAALDQFNVQTYYPTTAVVGFGWQSWFLSPLGGWSGSTPISIEDTFERYVAAGVPKAKLGMGTATYAICYTGGITGPRQSTEGGGIQITGGDNDYGLHKLFAAGSTYDTADSSERKRDDLAKQPYLSFATPVNDPHCGSTQYISFEDEMSIAAKGEFARTNGYGGIIVWTINQGWLPANAAGGRARNSVLKALRDSFP